MEKQVVEIELTGGLTDTGEGASNFGLEQNTYDVLTQEVDAVFHVAGLLRHYGHWQDFYTANVTGTENVIAFAKTQLKKDIHFISTMGTGYNEERGKTVLPFTELEVQKDSYAENYYLKSKMLAEKALEEARITPELIWEDVSSLAE